MSKQTARNSYTREDGVVMVEVRPGVFVNEKVAYATPAARDEASARAERSSARKRADRVRDIAAGRRGRL